LSKLLLGKELVPAVLETRRGPEAKPVPLFSSTEEASEDNSTNKGSQKYEEN